MKKTPIFLAFGVILVLFLSLSMGQFGVSYEKIFFILFHPFKSGDLANEIIWKIRMPRILLAFFAGSALSLAGASLQGLFHNPLVDPHIIGVSSGAAFGGALAILFGLSSIYLLGLAFVFGFLALILVYSLASIFEGDRRLMLILSGIILAGVFTALVSLVQYLADTEEILPNIVFWLLGSFATSSWHKLLLLFIPVFIFGILLLKLRWRVNILSLEEQDANSLGLNVKNLRRFILLICAILTAAQVSVSGNIAWVGLVVPHLARLLVGPSHEKLLPYSFVLGGIFMVLVDDLARSITSTEIPIGIITALFGAPIFVFLLVYKQKKEKNVKQA